MTRENLLVRVLNSCETMANASVVCMDKTGTLTQNEMTVVAGTLGSDVVFVRDLAQHPERATSHDNIDLEDCEKASPEHQEHLAVELRTINASLPPFLCELVNNAIAINSTAFEDKDAATGATVFVGSKTETALLSMARDLGWANYKSVRDAAETLQVFPFSSERKAMGAIVRLPDGRARLYVKGVNEVLSTLCTRCVRVTSGAVNIGTAALADADRDFLSRAITAYASQTLRTIADTYRD